MDKKTQEFFALKRFIKYSRVKNIIQTSFTMCGCGMKTGEYFNMTKTLNINMIKNVFKELCRSGSKKYHHH
jgi:hypothetical protein